MNRLLDTGFHGLGIIIRRSQLSQDSGHVCSSFASEAKDANWPEATHPPTHQRPRRSLGDTSTPALKRAKGAHGSRRTSE